MIGFMLGFSFGLFLGIFFAFKSILEGSIKYELVNSTGDRSSNFDGNSGTDVNLVN